jgi:hypothetical protein
MDLDALKADAKKALSALPPEVVNVLMFVAHKVLDEHRANLEKAFPTVLEILKPHAQAAMFEVATGIIDGKGLEDTLTAALSEVVSERMNDGQKTG